MPTQNGIGRYDGRNLGQRLSPKNVAFDGEPSPLVIVQ
jgi:hypothetical protein